MSTRSCIALLLLLSACATTEPALKEPVARGPRRANLQRAVALPWRDEGRCVVQEASHPWPVVVERCFHALDTRRVRFRDTERRCAVASTDAASLETMVGICLLTQPELAVGAVVIIGVVVVAVAIKEELDAYELKGVRPEEVRPVPVTKPLPLELLPKRRPKPEQSPSGEDWPPPAPPKPRERERRPECTAIPVPHLGGDELHNTCADWVPQNAFPGKDVLVNGKNFDALQPATRTLWEIKTDDFAKHSRRSRNFFIDIKLPEIQRERRLAEDCGYNFAVGVRSEAHKAALLEQDRTLKVVVMEWC